MASLNVRSLYRAAEQAQQKQYQSAKKQSKNRLNSTLRTLDSDYRRNVTAAQSAARVSALGNEEKLAAAGLNFGSAYGAATSGYAETSRVAQTNTLRNNLSNLSSARTAAIGEAQNQYSSEVAAASQARYEALSNIRLQRAKATISYQQQRYQNALNRWKTYGYVLPADAKILGVKAGTRTASRAYDEAKLAIDRIKALK